MTEYTRRGGYRCASGRVPTTEAVGVGIGFPDQLDWVAWSDGAALDHPRHLTGATHHRFQRVGVDFEHFSASRPIARNLDLGITNTQPGTVRQLHHGHAFDGDVLTQDTWLDRHAALRQFPDRFGIEDADLALGAPSMAVAFEAEVRDQATLVARQLAELFFGVAVDGYETRAH
jgi:hypothetical protein